MLREKTDRFFELKGELEEVRKQEKDLVAQLEQLEYEIVQQLEKLGLEQIRTDLGSLTVNTKMYPSIKAGEKEDFIKWAVENNRTDMLVVRPNEAAVRSFFEEANVLPAGVDTYMKTKLNMRRR